MKTNIIIKYRRLELQRWLLFLILPIGLFSCENEDNRSEPVIEDPVPGEDILFLPVVVHVIHNGEPEGEGPNLSTERIERQIEILNEDFRRKEGTRGFNDHTDGGDSEIEFVLAQRDPSGASTNGIVRVDSSQFDVPLLGYGVNHFAQYSYWNPQQYINIWTTPLPESTTCLVLGVSTGPDTDLPGSHLMTIPGPEDAEGILVNWIHFGESDIDCHARYGRTLTHEIGHYLGLLHPWADHDCEPNDYCEDTPAVDDYVYGRIAFIGCQGDTIMIGNYMNWSDDEIMNIFTNDQISRMHYALAHDADRHSLLTSPGIDRP